MATALSDRYAAISQHLFQQAQEELARGDLLQASEKAWGSAAHAIKAVAEEREWNHYRHDLLRDITTWIADEWDNPRLHGLYAIADAMHRNYYAHAMYGDEVQRGIDNSRTLMREMEEVRGQPPRPFVPQTEDQRRRLRRLTRRSDASERSVVEDLPPVEPEPPLPE